jgi:hypothetical protein
MRKPSTKLIAVSLGVAGLGIFGFLALRHGKSRPVHPLASLPPVYQPQAPFPTKKQDLEALIETNKTSPDKLVQDRVGAARIRLGYLAANKQDWQSARATFQLAEREYKGTGAMSADFGGVSDQAAYQAAVCLVPEGKKAEAEAEFIKFMKERPLSPLAKAAFRRLERLNGGTPKPEWEALLQSDVSQEEAHVRFETSVCGPKTIAYLLPQLGKPPRDYKEIAKLAGTRDEGTTLLGMCKALKTLGVAPVAYKLNRQDLERANLPVILLQQDHYVALTKIEGEEATIYDTRFNEERQMKLPALDDPDYSVAAILFRPLAP